MIFPISKLLHYREAVVDLAARSQEGRSIYFRGQRNHTWKLKSGLGRDAAWAGKSHDEREQFQKRLIEEFRSLCIRHELFRGSTAPADEEALRIAQHHGLPTTKLDWSSSYYVALAFAFNLFSTEPLDSKAVRVWSLDWERFQDGAIELQRAKDEPDADYHLTREALLGRFEARHDGIALYPYFEASNRRLNRQQGAFTECRHETLGLDEYVLSSHYRSFFPTGTLTWFDICPFDEREVRWDMEKMGLDPAALMADLDGAALTVRNRHFR